MATGKKAEIIEYKRPKKAAGGSGGGGGYRTASSLVDKLVRQRQATSLNKRDMEKSEDNES